MPKSPAAKAAELFAAGTVSADFDSPKLAERKKATEDRVQAIAIAMKRFQALSAAEILLDVNDLRVKAAKNGLFKTALDASKLLLEHLEPVTHSAPPKPDAPKDRAALIREIRDNKIRANAIEMSGDDGDG